ncbi:MAG: hypothetical protein H8E37_10930, partial [Planctomycetes bacterium]|nr:hypothetical protein [Planctomycetota bacterium]
AGVLRRISESNREKKTSHRPPTDESAPAFFYAIAMAAGATAAAMLFTRGGVSLLLFFAVALGALVILRRWTVGVILLLVQAALLVGRQQDLMHRASIPDLILASAIMTLLVAASRFLIIAPELSPVADLSEATRRYVPKRFRGKLNSLVRRDGNYCPAERFTAVLRVLIAVGGAALLLRSIPVNPFALDEFWLIPSGLRVISLGILLLTIFLVTDFLLDVLTWRRISTSEARVFLRSVLTSWCDRELRAIYRHNLKQRRRRR